MLKKITLFAFLFSCLFSAQAQSPFGLCEPTTDFGTTDGDYISSIDYEGVNFFTGSTASDFLNYQEDVFNMEVGSTHYIDITNSEDINAENVKIWIDLNFDGTLDPNTELMSSFTFTSAGQSHSFPVTIPSDAIPGMVGCRITMHYINAEDGPCDDLTYGQIVDFPLSINSNPGFYCYSEYSTGALDGDYLGSMITDLIYYYGGTFSANYVFLPDFESTIPGGSITFDCTAGTYGNDNFLLFVDEDNNGFTVADMKDSHDATNSGEGFELVYTAPNSLESGVYRARVVAIYGSNQEPCASDVGFGHTIDFRIICTAADASPYCTPVADNGTADGDYIAVFELENSPIYSSQSTAGPYYTDYSDPADYMPYYALSGRNCTGTIISGSYNGSDNYKVWIDYNQNNVFDTNELMSTSESTGSGQTINISWVNPEYTNQGFSRMRAMCHYTDNVSDPCDLDNYGEVEDFGVVLVKSNDIYCDPYFSSGNADGDFINNFSLNEVSLMGIGEYANTFYKDYTWQTAQVLPGGSYTITVQSGDYATDTYKIWVDWNNDGTFDNATEAVGTEITASGSFQDMVFTLNVPGNVTLGNKRLRLVCADATGLEPCQEDSYGEYLEITVAVVTEIGLPQLSAEEITLFPNPGKDNLTIQYTGVSNVLNATIHNAMGQLIDAFQINQVHTMNHNYAPGYYTMKLSNGTSEIHKVFIVE